MATIAGHAGAVRGSARRARGAALGRFTLGELVDATGARLVRGDPELALGGVSTDTRTLRAGDVFLALAGPNFDGNRFAPQAVAAGARALLLADTQVPAGLGTVPLVLHADPRRALGDLGAWYRSTLDARVLAVTGSCGKTTTKNILHQLLSVLFPVVSSPSSYNNDIGVPHTLLSADDTTRLLVVEMGTNHPGEIAALCRIARPEVGIVTNVGASHLEGLGSLEGVALEKGALPESLPADGLCVLNRGSRHYGALAARTRARVISFSVEGSGAERGDLDARELYFHSGGTTFKLNGHEVTSPLLGTHNVENLLAALCVAESHGIALERLLSAVSNLRASHSRMERIELDGITLFDDCYNANPQSLRAAVRVLAGLHGHRRRVLVMGDMLELGELSAELHHQIGREAAHAGVDSILMVGTYVKAAASGALEGGLGPEALLHFATTEEAARGAAEAVREGDVVLVKGSRGMALERVVTALKERWAPTRTN